MAWTLAQAREQLAEIVERARTEGPQVVEIDGEPRGVIVTPEQWSGGRSAPADSDEAEPDPADMDFKDLLRLLGSALNGEDPERPIDDERRF